MCKIFREVGSWKETSRNQQTPSTCKVVRQRMLRLLLAVHRPRSRLPKILEYLRSHGGEKVAKNRLSSGWDKLRLWPAFITYSAEDQKPPHVSSGKRMSWRWGGRDDRRNSRTRWPSLSPKGGLLKASRLRILISTKKVAALTS